MEKVTPYTPKWNEKLESLKSFSKWGIKDGRMLQVQGRMLLLKPFVTPLKVVERGPLLVSYAAASNKRD